jgi:RHS repeat-associated protein
VSYSDGTPQVVYNYDAYGARSSVTDGEGATSYSYNNYRQLESETRTFTGLANQSFTLGYTYNQADQVRSVHHINTFQNVTGPDVSVSDKGSAAGPFSLSGQITNQQGQPQSQVMVQLWNMGIHPVATVTTDTNGQYSFSNLTAGGTYSVRPVATSGTVFTPGGRIYANLRRDWTNVNFTVLPATLTTYDKMVNYAYNPVGALAGVGTNLIGSDANNTSNVLNTVSFRANGALRQLHYGNERRLTMGYNDNRSQPISMKVDRVNNPADKIIDNSYEYYMTDPETGASVNNNRIRRIVDNTGYGGDTADYYYDQYNRLTNVQGTGYFRYYLYDPFGNIKDFSAVTLNYATNATGAPATNRIQSDGVGFNYSYDEAGNMTVGMGQSFAYDGANRMKTASYGNSAYGYDGGGKRVKKTENGATTYYVQSSALKNTAMEVNSTGVLRAYVYSGGRLAAMQATDGQFYWIHANHLNSSRAMTDVNGNLTYKGQFDPYGQTVTEWSASGSNNLNTKKFTGYERDASTGLDYAEARMYNSGRGRFTSPDKKGLASVNLRSPQTLNRYVYTNNDPINFVDVTGLDEEPFVIRLYIYDTYLGSANPGRGGGALFGGEQNFLPVDPSVDGPGDVGLMADLSTEVKRVTLDNAIKRAKARIKGDCAKLFGNLKVDDYLKNNVSILLTDPLGNAWKSETTDAATADNPVFGTRSTHFNPNSTFFTDSREGITFVKWLANRSQEEKDKLGIGSNIKSLADYQELVVLHELYHAAETTLTDDGKNPAAGVAIDKAIQEKCFKGGE